MSINELKPNNMWITTIMAILIGILEIQYAYKSVEKDNKRIKRVFIMMGLLTIMLGLFCLYFWDNQ